MIDSMFSPQSHPPSAATSSTVDPATRTRQDSFSDTQTPDDHGGEGEHRAALNASDRVAQLTALSSALNARARAVVQRLPLTDAQWTHIARGEVNNGKLVGYHWTGDAEAIAEKSGDGSAPDARGVYQASVRTIAATYGKRRNERLAKSNVSTFWPDGWSAEDIRSTIRAAGTARQTFSEVPNTAEKVEARGMSLQVNPDSVFPVYDPPVEDEGKRKGGRRGGKR